jgi:S-adenosylmethionine hydrolase
MFSASGIITLTTDFGYRDPFVATMKGRILDRLPTARIVDVTHETSVYWPAEAGFWLSRAYPYFSIGSVHIAVVDPGVGTSRSIIGVEADGHLFLAPNNGLLASVLARVQAPLIHQLDLAHALKRFGLSQPSSTFHGRDIFAPIAAELAAGRASLADLGPEIKEVAAGQVAEPTVSSGGISGVVITIDHFGNLITNIDESLIRSFRRPVVHISNQTVPVHRTYGDAKPGDLLALINSFGVIEIAIAEGNGAAILGCGRSSKVQVLDT